MKKLIVLAFALSLAACATIQNPFSRDELAAIEASVGTAVTTFNGYKQLCADRIIPPSCRTAVQAVQVHIPQVRGALNSARNFVKNYPQLSPAASIGAVQAALGDFLAAQSKYGVK